jgi:predicted O-methyltransferase YrrM
VVISAQLRDLALATTGFMPVDEGDALHEAALAAARSLPGLPLLEVGSYCGRSTIWLGDAARQANTVLFAVDHHRGSEENQPGWEWHDETLVDPVVDLEEHVLAVVGQSPIVAKNWTSSLAFLFIDGGHGVEPARLDYELWTPHVAVGGTLAIHDVFPDPADGGRPPYEQIYLPAINSGRFEDVSATGSLRVLRRVK